MANTQKFLDEKGVQHLWSKISMEDYPNNETLIAVLNAIDQTKVDKIDGKGLSANDFTNEYKEKLDDLENISPAIIDVASLPTEDIREDVFYRVVTGTFIFNKTLYNRWICHTVEGLPEIGEPVTTTMTDIEAYYNSVDGIVYGYINDALSSMANAPIGWYTFDILAPAFNTPWGGVITDISEGSTSDTWYLLLEHVIYSYKDSWKKDDKKIGFEGTSLGAEIFNDPANEASDMYSHAEGWNTTASGQSSHAEGHNTVASNSNSHAEGYNTIASGIYSHAENNYTTASGHGSHAEGYNTIASGQSSHAEGFNTIASNTDTHAEGNNTIASGNYSHAEGCGTNAQRKSQHTQGEYNILDTTGDASVRGKYAHIVGNGISETDRSNAHTLDWDGNAWYQGDVYVGSTSGINKDEGSIRLARINEIPLKMSQLENDSKFVPEDEIKNLFKNLSSNRSLSFYCIEDVEIIINDVSTIYPANSNVDIKLLETDTWEIIPTSDNSIQSLTGFPGALGTYYSWLEGVKQFSNILFDMNNVEFYSKWSQGNQGAYQVQFAQYINCIFWSDNGYVSDVSKRTNYTLYNTAQLPLCYSSIPDNTFKAFFLAFGVNSDPNWGNKAYRDSFAKATWATQAFSYYGARTIGVFGHDDPDFNITLPKDCRGLMYQSTAIENAGTFDAINTTNFGAKSGSWRDAFGWCTSLRNLFIKNLKVNLNISWSPINYESISFIIEKAANENAITISVSPYTYNLLDTSDFELATSKNITIELITTNYVEDRRLSTISTKADKSYVDERVAALVNSAPETLDTLGELATAFNENKTVVDALDAAITVKKNADIIVTYAENSHTTVTHDTRDLYDEIMAGTTVYFKKGTELLTVMEADPSYITFFMFYLNMNNQPQQKVVVITGNSIMIDQDDIYNYVTNTDLNESLEDYYNKLETDTLINDAITNITIPESGIPAEYDEVILKSSTEGSSKKFKLTIDDDGVLIAEEVL